MINRPEVIIVHHSGGSDANTLLDTSNQTAQIIKDYHLSLGWENVGYHWLIEKSGRIVKGREENYHGAHCTGWNQKSIGICVIGNFDITLPTKEQEISLTKLLKEILVRYPQCKDKIYPHRKYAKKSCYGKLLSDDWALNLVKEEDTVAVPRLLIEQLSKYL